MEYEARQGKWKTKENRKQRRQKKDSVNLDHEQWTEKRIFELCVICFGSDVKDDDVWIKYFWSIDKQTGNMAPVFVIWPFRVLFKIPCFFNAAFWVLNIGYKGSKLKIILEKLKTLSLHCICFHVKNIWFLNEILLKHWLSNKNMAPLFDIWPFGVLFRIPFFCNFCAAF